MLRHFIPRNDKRVFAFTLAEVLITLMVIGVIAALTIPNLMHKWHQKEYETRFKKTYAIVAQALERMKAEDGDRFWDRYANYRALGNSYGDFATPFYSYFKHDNYKTYNSRGDKWFNQAYGGIPLKNYAKQNGDTVVCGYHLSEARLVINDAFSIYSVVNCHEIVIAFDTNTFRKGPNAMGYDVFFFNIDRNNDHLVAYNRNAPDCSKTSGHGIGCSYYAMINKCPADSTKTYWECLE